MEQYSETSDCSDSGKIFVPETELPRVVVVGGGFAGLNLIKGLKKASFQVVLVDKNNFHQFLPLLYQVATSGIEPDNIVFPFRKLFEKYTNVVFRMAEATSVDTASNLLNTAIGAIPYDYLVLASGSVTNFFGNSNFKKYGSGLNSISDALDLRSRILQNLEKASIACLDDHKKKWSSIAIVGGGATGVEIAGALGEFKRYVLPKDYPELKNVEMKIYLIEASERLLSAMPEKLSEKTKNYLLQMGIEILLETRVNSYENGAVVLANGKRLNAATYIWAAGVQPLPIQGLPPESLDKLKRIVVDDYNRVKTLENVFAIGDNALLKTKQHPNGHPMQAQPAIQQGKTLAKNLVNLINHEPLIGFGYNDKGTMATIGKKKAVAQVKKFLFSGFFAWLVWSFVHLKSLVGFRDKLMVAINWMWSYFTYDIGNRIIIRKYDEP